MQKATEQLPHHGRRLTIYGHPVFVKKMLRNKIMKCLTSCTLKVKLLLFVFSIVLAISIYKKSLEGRIANENSRGIICLQNGTINKRISMKESVMEDSFYAVNKKERRRNTFPLQPKNLLEVPEEAFNVEISKNVTEEKKLKKILIWNSVGSVLDIGFGRTPFLIGECHYNNCFVTAQKDRYDANELDALIWHVRGTDRSLPKTRYPNARYVFLNWEPVVFLFANMQDYKDIFDLTLTYREDSDIPYPYNEVASRNITNKTYLTSNFSSGKSKAAAWFVTNCNAVSGRSKLVKQLQKYLKIDVYGPCGNLACGTPHNPYDCFKMVEKEYFFYLSFENSLCKDYITEKFFNALRYEVVPVVYGYGPYWKHAPPHSYIDVFNFTSIKELAKYLAHLTKSPEEYNEYFRWKTNYFVLPRYSGKMHAICKLCEIMNTPKSTNASRYDLQDWVVKQSRCREKGDPIISSFLGGKKLAYNYNQIRCFINSENC